MARIPLLSKRKKARDQKAIQVGNVNSLIMFFVLIVAVIFTMSIIFRISDITVSGNEHYTDQEIINAIDIEEGDNLFFYDRFATISRVFAKLPYVEEITVERNLPNKVKITVVECKALAYLVVGDEYWTMDHTCKILGKAVDSELEELIAVTGIEPGTLMIGERLTISDGSTAVVDHLSEVLYQIQARGYSTAVNKLDFSKPKNVSMKVGKTYTVQLGDSTNIEKKFGLFKTAMGSLLADDTGVINVSDGMTIHFIPF